MQRLLVLAVSVSLLLATTGAVDAAQGGKAAAVAKQEDGFGVNPIRRVVTMLQMMAKKVAAEGEKEEEMFDKFMCYCETSGSALRKSIEEAEAKVPQLEADIK